jgi:hypothetical protein
LKNRQPRSGQMKGKVLVLCCTALLIAGCAVPLGEDYLITRGGSDLIYITDYNLQSYIPVPKTGEGPITLVDNRGDLEMSVVWKDTAGTEIPLPFDAFLPNTEYQAEIRITAKPGYGFYPSTPFAYPEGKIKSQNDDLGEPARIIRVAYNNSDDADITYITDYNLQNYVPVPLAGEEPVRSVSSREDVTVTVTWKEKDSPVQFAGRFASGTEYQAKIRLRVKPGYRFRALDFAYPVGAVAGQPASDTDPEDRDLTWVSYWAARTPTVINDLNLTPYIPKPVSGAMPVSAFAGPQYTGLVIWKDAGSQTVLAGPFQGNTEYTAEIGLTPAMGYTITGAGVFIHTGARTVTNSAGSGTVSIGFSATARAEGPLVVYDTDLTGRISRPIEGLTPVRTIAGNQYTGTVVWTPSHHTFQLGTVYTAKLTLNAAEGYTFAGIGQNVFTHRDAPGGVTNPGGGNTVTIAFPPAASSANPAMTFGPVEREGSALWLINEKRDYIYPLVIDLPFDSEDIFASATLTAGDNSPAEVIINGHNRVLKVKTAGALLMVGGGVTLTLQNIRFEGLDGNTAPLFMVWSGGTLILGEGVTLKDNKTTADAGGVWVNGGTLIMEQGAKIEGMAARRGGGVLVDVRGRFYMNGGTIGGELPGTGNRVSGMNAGGGVLVNRGSFDMFGGTIQFNEADNSQSGGGVCVFGTGRDPSAGVEGTFNQYAGTVKKNTAKDNNSGGGVYVTQVGMFKMNDVSAVVEGNIVQGDNSGGGVYIDNGFLTMNQGIIRWNRALAGNSGGGVFAINGNDMVSFHMYNGTITGNIAEGADSGGGIYNRENDITIHAGSISENEARGINSGGGAYIGGQLHLLGTAAIVDNIALEAGSGGGIYIAGRGYSFCFVFNHGTIQGNKALYRGSNVNTKSANGVYIDDEGMFSNHTSGKITGNTADNTDNYGVFIKNTNFRAFRLEGGEVDDRVFLCSGAAINIMDQVDGFVNIITDDPSALVPYNYTSPNPNQATKFLCANSSGLINTYKDRFLYDGDPVQITTNGIPTIGMGYYVYYGYYTE